MKSVDVNQYRSLSAFMLIAVTASCLSAGCASGDAREDPERIALERERDALTRYLAHADTADLVPFDGFLVAVREDLIRDVVQAALPHTTTVADRYRLELSLAEVRFRNGLALVDLAGRAALADRPGVWADLTVVGLFRVLDLDPHRATLRARVEVLGFETREVGVGRLAPPLERLVDGLASRHATELDEVLGQLEVPVRLWEQVELPAVEEPEISIPSSALAVRLQVTDVRVLQDRIFVSVSADLVDLPAPADPIELTERGDPEGQSR